MVRATSVLVNVASGHDYIIVNINKKRLYAAVMYH